MNPDQTTAADPADGSLVLGGPLYQMYLRTRLARPPLDLLHRRVVLFIALAWLPLMLLTLPAGTKLGGVKVPFLMYVDTLARFLIAVPLLLWADLAVHGRIRVAVREFRDRRLIADADLPRFEQVLAG